MDEWAVLVASAGVSAVVSSVVSLTAVRAVTVRQARAGRAEAARVAVRAEVGPLIDRLARYRFQTGLTTPSRKPDVADMEDHGAVVRIRTAAADLPRWRRHLVDRRCRRVFGKTWTNLAIEFPTKPTGNESIAAWFVLAVDHRDQEADLGLMQDAYSVLPGHPSQHRLAGELRRLAASR